MKKSYSDVVSPAALPVSNSTTTHLNPAAREFVPKSNDQWPAVNQNRYVKPALNVRRPSDVSCLPQNPILPGSQVPVTDLLEESSYYTHGTTWNHPKPPVNPIWRRSSPEPHKVERCNTHRELLKGQLHVNDQPLQTNENWPSCTTPQELRPESLEQMAANASALMEHLEVSGAGSSHKKHEDNCSDKNEGNTGASPPNERFISNSTNPYTHSPRNSGEKTGAVRRKAPHLNKGEDDESASKFKDKKPSGKYSSPSHKQSTNKDAARSHSSQNSSRPHEYVNEDRRQAKKQRDLRMEREKLNQSEGRVPDMAERAPSKLSWSTSSSAESEKEKAQRDKAFECWEKTWHTIQDYIIVKEIEGDLFAQPKNFSLAHCVAEDLRMGSGIAVSFKREFKNLPDLLDQRAKQGGLATLWDEKHNRFVYYLVTKRESNGKPTYHSLWKSLCKMSAHTKEHEVKEVAIPRLGCGLDRLEWNKVKSMLELIFKEADVEITVCNFQQIEQAQEKKSKCQLTIQNSQITEIESGTLILYFTTCKGDQDEIMRKLAAKTNFLPALKKHEPKALGDIVYSEDNTLNWGICGCIVRETKSEPISFKSLHKCLQKINKKNNGFGADRFYYIATQCVDSNSYFDDAINEKIITMLTTFLRDVSVYICGLEKKNSE